MSHNLRIPHTSNCVLNHPWLRRPCSWASLGDHLCSSGQYKCFLLSSKDIPCLIVNVKQVTILFCSADTKQLCGASTVWGERTKNRHEGERNRGQDLKNAKKTLNIWKKSFTLFAFPQKSQLFLVIIYFLLIYKRTIRLVKLFQCPSWHQTSPQKCAAISCCAKESLVLQTPFLSDSREGGWLLDMYLSVAGVLIKDAAVGGRFQTIKIANSKLYWSGQAYTTYIFSWRAEM